MKANAFEKLIRKVVREEIDYALQREIRSLKEDLRNELKPIITEQPTERRSIPKNVQSSLKEKIMGKPISQNFVADSTLNSLLNETAQGNTNLESTIAAPEAPMTPEISNVINRDYRELMRAIDKKKNKTKMKASKR